MWNGFKGEYGGYFTPLLAIAITTVTNLAYTNLHLNSFYLLPSYISINISIPFIEDAIYFFLYIVFSWVLFIIVPGKFEIGPINNSGKRYQYKLNSLSCLLLEMIIQGLLAFTGIVPLETMSKYFHRVILVSIFFGWALTLLVYVKGKYFPTFINNESFGRNDFVEDFYSGIELVPRFTANSPYDLKLFSIGHIGMIIWQLLNISHAAYGWNRGSIDALVVCLMQSIYIFDWAIHERWYLYTVDIQHDRLGYYLTYGAFSWMPTIYTAYGYYASHLKLGNSYLRLFIVVFIYLFGYWLMRTSNNQKEGFRKNHEKLIWGKKPLYMIANYKTQDGATRQNKLLLSGFWGWARHFNYIGDLLLCLSLSILCGFDCLGASIYSFQLTGILLTRAVRDDARCQLKYGDDWKEYKKKNPYLLIPGIW